MSASASSDQLNAACAQFEAFMLRRLLEDAGFGRLQGIAPNDDDGEDEEIATGAGRPIMQSLFVEALATALAGAGGIGIARELGRTLLRT